MFEKLQLITFGSEELGLTKWTATYLDYGIFQIVSYVNAVFFKSIPSNAWLL